VIRARRKKHRSNWVRQRKTGVRGRERRVSRAVKGKTERGMGDGGGPERNVKNEDGFGV